MKDNVLKKEFSKKDVQRARNLITGNTGARTTEGVGYTKKYEHHKEGDVWEENGRKWTIKNGLKQNITKMDKFKKLGKMPLFCPECNTLMKKELDKKVFPAYQKCFDCIVDYEAELHKQGKAKDYFKGLQHQHIQSAIDGYKAFMESAIKESNSNFVTEAGDVENWKGGKSKEELEQELQEGIEFLESLKVE
jgi:DNA-directed RNA polymerase subunit M/transcription elongation factor TFIIS